MIDLKKADQHQITFLNDAYQNKKIAHAYLFVDPIQESGIATAYWLACRFMCTGEKKPDGQCNNCQRILSGNHPDVFLVKLDGKQSLSIEQIRPLKAELAKSPVEGTHRFFIIENAEKLTLAANNALLNLLEEPVAPVVTILVTNNESKILPTVRSRTQILHFEEEVQDNRALELLEYGLSNEEIADLTNSEKLEQETKYLYQEIKEKDNFALVRVHHLAENKSSAEQKFILFILKKLALTDLEQDLTRQSAARILDLLVHCDQMRASNVSFRNCLDYLVLKY
ncbi:DNA polymerase III subunit delta [Lactobacillus sp. PV034]|uniref:DNA polymerase III subunit delta n=1 Tax=Lactobacillus sp. PV034 TaxID=2594495 RepID=UPI00223FA170|nr:DNA polymerase III subunit delta [Lactobacillus sp. PV034]QNQ81435.1 DNA polymerase III subunit delta [Lactobacillus sp. PV034]